MKSNRVVPLLTIGAVVVCLGLIGFPWQTPEVLGNFSGRVVYASGDGNLDLTGHFNLYNCAEPPSCIRVKILWNGHIQDIEVDRSNGTFSGRFRAPSPIRTDDRARIPRERVRAPGRFSASGRGPIGDQHEVDYRVARRRYRLVLDG